MFSHCSCIFRLVFFKFRSSQGKFVFRLIWKSVPTLCCLHTFLSPQSCISWSFVVLYFSSMYSCVFKVMSPHCSRSASLSVFRLLSSRCRKVRTRLLSMDLKPVPTKCCFHKLLSPTCCLCGLFPLRCSSVFLDIFTSQLVRRLINWLLSLKCKEHEFMH